MTEESADLVQYRIEQADAALNDAKFLLDGKRSAQSIINRAYYAMFYAALVVRAVREYLRGAGAGGG